MTIILSIYGFHIFLAAKSHNSFNIINCKELQSFCTLSHWGHFSNTYVWKCTFSLSFRKLFRSEASSLYQYIQRMLFGFSQHHVHLQILLHLQHFRVFLLFCFDSWIAISFILMSSNQNSLNRIKEWIH
jgi:hypothetical protein